jgi:hypothetical protein
VAERGGGVLEGSYLDGHDEYGYSEIEYVAFETQEHLFFICPLAR